MKVTVYVPVELEIKGNEKVLEVHEQLEVLNKIISMSELQSKPNLLVSLVGDCEIIEEESEDDIIIIERGEKYEGTRGKISNGFFSYSYNSEIIKWCSNNGWSLSINGKEILK